MKRILTILSVLVAAMALVSCNKDGEFVMSYCTYEVSHGHLVEGVDNVEVLDAAWKNKKEIFENMSDAEAKAEWDSFLKSIDESQVKIVSAQGFYTISFVKYNVYEKGDVMTEKKLVATIGTRTWTKGGVK